MSSIQADVRSPLGSRLVPALLLAIERVQAEDSAPGSVPALSEVVLDPAYDAALVDEVRAMLLDWQAAGFEALSGVDPDDNEALPLTEPAARSAQATLLFNAWLVRVLNRTFGDELARVGRPAGTSYDTTAFVHIVGSDPATLATFDPETGDSALWDDLDTPAIETRHERMIRALLDALSWLEQRAGAVDTWRWGHFHTVRFEAVIPVFATYSIPTSIDPVFRDGFPRHGDSFVVDASNFSLHRLYDDELDFSYTSGPTQRFVIELAPGKLEARNALPGGAVWHVGHPHFADQAELWRRNETKVVPFVRDDVIAARESQTLILPSGS
jgi:penicillin amidase